MIRSAQNLGGEQPPEAPTEAEIREQFDRISSSPEFHAPDRGRSFFSYVVEETIAGRGGHLKAYSIALEVFGRDASFDAQSDPAVRIEAGRIRRSLERYYLIAGQSDPIIVTIPKGGYVPIFTRAPCLALSPEPPPASADPTHLDRGWLRKPLMWLAGVGIVLIVLILVFFDQAMLSTSQQPLSSPVGEKLTSVGMPRILVEPFEDLSGTADSAMIARGLTDEVIGQLSKFKEIIIIAGELSGGQGNASADRYGSRHYALEGRVRVDGNKLRLTTRFLNRSDGSVIWANNYDRALRVQDLLDVEADIARGVATALAQPYGIIFQTDATQLAQSAPDDWDAYACTLEYYGYRSDLNPQSHASVQDCLKRATQRFPQYATFWALLSLTYLDELRFRYRPDLPPTQSLNLAHEAAERAVGLDPHNVRALQAQMLAYFFMGQIDTALKVGANAVAINPNDTEIIAEYGFRLALSGQWGSGCAMISEAMARNPAPKRYFEVALALCAYMKKDYATAEQWATIGDLRDNPIYRVILLAILGARGKLAEADEEQHWLQNNAPQLLKNIRREVATRIYRVEDQEHFLDGLRAAGVAVPER